MPAVGLILLAAGASVRMGEPKQLLSFQGQTLLRRAAETALASACRPVVVVLGAHSARLQPELNGLDLHVVANAHWKHGVGSSIRAGVTALLSTPHPEVEAVVLMLCDQPLLTAAHLNALIAAYEVNGSALIASEYAQTLGAPALFPRALFPQLLQLQGTVGAHQLILSQRASTVPLPFPEGELDLDTPDDVARLRERSPL